MNEFIINHFIFFSSKTLWTFFKKIFIYSFIIHLRFNRFFVCLFFFFNRISLKNYLLISGKARGGIDDKQTTCICLVVVEIETRRCCIGCQARIFVAVCTTSWSWKTMPTIWTEYRQHCDSRLLVLLLLYSITNCRLTIL